MKSWKYPGKWRVRDASRGPGPNQQLILVACLPMVERDGAGSLASCRKVVVQKDAFAVCYRSQYVFVCFSFVCAAKKKQNMCFAEIKKQKSTIQFYMQICFIIFTDTILHVSKRL